MKETQTRLDVHQAITDRIVASIEEGSAGTFRMRGTKRAPQAAHQHRIGQTL